MINMAKKWERSEAVVAQRISISQIGGFTGKKIQLSSGETAILEKDGESVQTFGEGKHKVSGMFSGGNVNVVLIDGNPKVIRRDAKDLWTGDDKKINAAIEMRFEVSEPEKLRKLMMGKRNVLTIEDVWSELRREIVSNGIEPVVRKKKIDKILAKRDIDKEMHVAVEVEARKKFEVFGLDLLSFSAEFILPDDYEAYLEKRSEMKEEAEKKEFAGEEETRKAVRERDIGEIKGTAETREKVIDDMEKERIRREAEMHIEEEETQQDMKDAMEGLKLKELKDEEKSSRMGLETLKEVDPKKGADLEDKYDTLQRMMGETEKKFLNRKLEKNTFKRLMEDYEKEKTELEVKMRKRK